MSIDQRIKSCHACPTMACASLSCSPSGSRRSKTMIIAYNPLRGDCYGNEPLSDVDSALIDQILHAAGLNRSSVYITYAVKGYDESGKPGKRIANTCARLFLYRELLALKPTKVVLLGADVFNLFFDKLKISDFVNKVLIGPHYHVFSGNALSYFRKTGDTTQLSALVRDLSSFLSDDYVVEDVEPIESIDQLAAEFTQLKHDRVDPSTLGFMEYDSGREALMLAKQFAVKTDNPVIHDIETIGLKIDLVKPRDALITCGLSDGEKTLSVGMDDLTREEFIELYKIILEIHELRPVGGHNYKYDLKPFVRVMVKKRPFWTYRLYDTLIMSHIVNELEGSYGLKDILHRRYGIDDYAVDLTDPTLIPLREMREYNAQDCFYNHRLLVDVWKQMTRKQKDLYQKIVSPLVLSTAYMEVCGLPYSRDATERMIEFLEWKRDTAEELIEGLVGSLPLKPKLFTEFLAYVGWKTDRLSATKQGYFTLSADNLSALAASNRSKVVRQFTSLVLERQKYNKMVSTYSTGATALHKFEMADGRIHCGWWLANASTGRVATSSPNVLNIERADRLPLIMRKNIDSQPRNQFKVVRGRKLVKADMSQAELRVLACMTKDKALLAAYISGKDIHTVTGSKMFKIALAAVEKWQRQIAKNINFGISYGQTAAGLAVTVNNAFAEQGIDKRITKNEAQEFIDLWLEAYSGAALWMEKQRELARRVGYTESAFGRRRHFTYSGNENADWSLDNQAVNHPIQSTSSDIVFHCQNRLLMLAHHIDQFMLVKNEYDAVFSECNDADVDEVVECYKKAFTVRVGDFDGFIVVPFEYDISVGESMADMQQIYTSSEAA